MAEVAFGLAQDTGWWGGGWGGGLCVGGWGGWGGGGGGHEPMKAVSGGQRGLGWGPCMPWALLGESGQALTLSWCWCNMRRGRQLEPMHAAPGLAECELCSCVPCRLLALACVQPPAWRCFNSRFPCPLAGSAGGGQHCGEAAGSGRRNQRESYLRGAVLESCAGLLATIPSSSRPALSCSTSFLWLAPHTSGVWRQVPGCLPPGLHP